jgi:type IV pilus assembly protein PilV
MNNSDKCVKDRLKRRMKGFTLIEVLVSVVVFSIGLIGLASLQTIALKNNNTSYMRSQAILLAQDIADRMRANRVAIDAGAYNMASVNLADPTYDCTASSMPSGDATCTPQQMAQVDLFNWAMGSSDPNDTESSIAEALPGGQGIVCIDSTLEVKPTPGSPQCDGIGNVYAIKIWWDEDHSGAINTDDPVFITSFRP